MRLGGLICILEPDALTLRLLAEALEDEGFTTLRLSVAAGALDIIRERRPDLLVLDTTLETQDVGWTLLATIKSDDGTRRLPVIVCTADVRGVKGQTALLCRPPQTSVLIKPFDSQTLLTKIRDALQGGAGKEGQSHTNPCDVVDS